MMEKGDTVQIIESRKVGEISKVDGSYFLVNVDGCTCGFYTSSDLKLISSKGTTKPTKMEEILISIDRRLSKLEKSLDLAENS